MSSRLGAHASVACAALLGCVAPQFVSEQDWPPSLDTAAVDAATVEASVDAQFEPNQDASLDARLEDAAPAAPDSDASSAADAEAAGWLDATAAFDASSGPDGAL